MAQKKRPRRKIRQGSRSLFLESGPLHLSPRPLYTYSNYFSLFFTPRLDDFLVVRFRAVPILVRIITEITYSMKHNRIQV